MDNFLEESMVDYPNELYEELVEECKVFNTAKERAQALNKACDIAEANINKRIDKGGVVTPGEYECWYESRDNAINHENVGLRLQVAYNTKNAIYTRLQKMFDEAREIGIE